MYCTITYMDGHDISLPSVLSFNWDEHNRSKNKTKHRVEETECEQVFYDTPVYFYDETHSQQEDRYAVYGMTELGRWLLIIFTIRHQKVRVISARDQSKKERRIYESQKKYSQI